ncbi:MAG: HAMP domain-containing sensor histidine kinase [Candidatus Krumholzibacteriia bacterium]|nr:HAMP domain-containing histidine kinase [bacterium]
MDTLRKIARSSAFWLGLVAVLAPLILLLGLQYRWLRRLGEAGDVLRQATLTNFVEAVSTEYEYYYRSRAERLLNVPAELFTEGRLQKMAGSWGSQELEGTRTLFVVDFTRAEFGNFLVYHPDEQRLVTPPSSDESLAIILACAPWQVRGAQRTVQGSGPLRVDEGDPANRIVLNPVANERGDLVGIAGFIVDEDFLRQRLLPKIVRKAFFAYFPQSNGESSDIGVLVTDRAGTPVLGSIGVAEASTVHRALPFLYTDWTLYLAQSVRAEEAWARTNFALNLALSLALALVLMGGLLFALRAARRAVRLSAMKSDFVSNVSHELRTPLASIRVYAELLRSGRVQGGEQVRHYGETIESESRRLSLLIENILDFSRIESGRKSYRLAPTQLESVVEAAVETFRRRPAARDFDVNYAGPDAALEPLLADAEALSRALGNLLDNALKYSGASREIDVTLRRTADEVCIAVRDRGIGIPREELARIFDRFHRVSKGLVHDVKGSGLGLAIVRHIAEAHGGRVGVESEPGAGSVFTLCLPLAGAGKETGAAGPRKEEHA